ncbi:MAG TPA: histidinol-phosphate transaminase [Candidatus Polarisedimenticolia bacterium]|nr:histidinol-phosphate transaminase [Candidatus Polarisedimenticolia bacterium]
MSPRIPQHLSNLMPYVPGQSEESAARGDGTEAPLKLASNENPLGPSPRALEAVRLELERSHRYPEGTGRQLREELARRLGVAANQIILGNGSTELVELLVRTFQGSGGSSVVPAGTFIMYRIAVLAARGRLVEVPLREQRIDPAAVAAACDPRTPLVFLANPNNPTGNYFTTPELQDYFRHLPGGVITVLDEAYREYLQRPDYPSGLDALREGRTVVVLRTFSKAHGLAGLRIGYGIGPADLIATMEKVRSPFNTSRVAQAAALAALDDSAHLAATVETNRIGLEHVAAELSKRGVPFTPSVANFHLVHFQRDAEDVHRDLLAEGVIARPMGAYGFPRSLRITVGTPPQNDRLLLSLDRVLAKGPPASS